MLDYDTARYGDHGNMAAVGVDLGKTAFHCVVRLSYPSAVKASQTQRKI